MQLLNGKAHGAMLMNSNGMDVYLGTSSVTFKTIGGIIDMYVFVGSSPNDVTEQYTAIVGRPAMMPYCKCILIHIHVHQFPIFIYDSYTY